MRVNAPSAAAKRILCVEDDRDTRELMGVLLTTYGYEPVISTSVSAALEQISLGGFALCILDNWLGQSSGIDLCKRIRAHDQHTPIIFYSGAAYKTDIQNGLNAGAQAYVVKPDFEHLEETIDRLVL
jgi:DNA-binding response OmpR family regulator